MISQGGMVDENIIISQGRDDRFSVCIEPQGRGTGLLTDTHSTV